MHWRDFSWQRLSSPLSPSRRALFGCFQQPIFRAVSAPSLARRDPSPPWQWTFFLGFAGVRGVVSLAAALGLPLFTADGAAFPGRDLILFVTFGIIVITLIGQGIVLPALVRWLSLDGDSAQERQRERKAEHLARTEALEAAQHRLEDLAKENGISEQVLSSLKTRHEYRAGRLRKIESEDGLIPIGAASLDARSLLIDTERRFIFGLLQEGKITDGVPAGALNGNSIWRKPASSAARKAASSRPCSSGRRAFFRLSLGLRHSQVIPGGRDVNPDQD